MAWCRQAASHYLSQCWPWSMSPYSVTRPQWVNLYEKHHQNFIKDALQFNDNQFTLSTCTRHLWINLLVILQADCLTEVTNVKDLFKVRHSLDFMVFHFFITCYFTPHHTNHGGIVIGRVCLFACCVSFVKNGDTGNSFLCSDSCIIGEIMRMFSQTWPQEICIKLR